MTLGRHKSQAQCPGCEHFMVPRVVSKGGEPSHSICPFCGSLYKNFQSDGNESAFAFGEFVARLWKMSFIEKGFVQSITQGGFSAVSAKSMFKVFKLSLVVGFVYLIC